VPILLIPILSCEGDVLGSLSELMGKMGTNSLVEGGVVVIDTSQGAKASGSMSALADLKEEDEGYEDAYKDAVKDIKDAATEALASKGSTKAKAFVEDMKKPLSDDTTVPTKVETAVEDLNTQLGLDFEIETEGDLLAAVLLVDLMYKAKDGWEGASEEEIMEFVSEALQVIDIVQTVSPVNGVKIDDILGELLGGDLSGLFRSRHGISRDGDLEEEIDFENYAALFSGGDDEEGATLVDNILDKVLGTLEILAPFSNDQWIFELLQNIEDDGDI